MLKAISSWFSSDDSSSTRKSFLMNSTQDAFSLPTHSPPFLPPATPYATRTASSDVFDLEPATAATYTYPPPPLHDAYNYLPNPAFDSSRANHSSSILPLHQTSPIPPVFYPPLSHTWNRIRRWLSEEYQELGDTLNYGVLPHALREIELTLGFTLPSSVRDSYLITDGQEPESLKGAAEGLFYGLTFLSLEDALEEWRFWREVDDDPSTGANPRLRDSMQSVPPGYVRTTYSNRGWFPLISDKAGNYLGVDMNPDQQGSSGQVIIFGRDFDVKVVIGSGDGEGGGEEELETGEGFEIGSGDGSDGSDDGLGYEGYFSDGARSRGNNGSSVGLRLTGEYRGWPVLEAWADRSYRYWLEAGLVTSEPPPERSIPPPQDDMSIATSQPLPPTPPLKPANTPPPLPSKLPAPKLVELPTAQDIIPNLAIGTDTLDSPTKNNHAREDEQPLYPSQPEHLGELGAQALAPDSDLDTGDTFLIHSSNRALKDSVGGYLETSPPTTSIEGSPPTAPELPRGGPGSS